MYLIHQATLFMLDHLRERLSLDREHTPEALENYGNTVSSTIPILIRDLRQSGRLRPGKRTMMLGFGVGLSWAGCVWTETWAAKQFKFMPRPTNPPTGPSSSTQAPSRRKASGNRGASCEIGERLYRACPRSRNGQAAATVNEPVYHELTPFVSVDLIVYW